MRILVLSTLSAILATLQLCVAQTHSSHAAFVQTTAYGNITFAATVVRDVGDLYFHIEGPAINSWVGFGVGSEMKGALMWIFYRSADRKGLTFCTRTADVEHIEPKHIQNSGCQLIVAEGVQNGLVTTNERPMFVANIHCTNFTSTSLNLFKRHGAVASRKENTPSPNNGLPYKQNLKAQRNLDLSGSGQRFIFALGATDRKLASDHKGAPLRRHSLFGHFSLNLSKAAVDSTEQVSERDMSAVGSWQNKDSQLVEEPTADKGGWLGTIHALLMCSTLVVLFPMGVVFLRMLEDVIYHAWMQAIGCACIVSGVAVGAWASRTYNQYENINNPHQILGLATASLILIQFGIGITHHYLYKNESRTAILRRIHVPLGSGILIAGTVNGFLGIWFTGGTYHMILYASMVGIVFTGMMGAVVWIKIVKKREWRRKQDRQEADMEFTALKNHLDEDELSEGGDGRGAYVDVDSGDIADQDANPGGYYAGREGGGSEHDIWRYEQHRYRR